MEDAEWIAELLSHGLVEASFVPPAPIQELRALTRDRRQFHREGGRHVQRIQKVLQDANIKLDSVLSDVMGVSGRSFLKAIVEGETRPEKLAEHANYRLKAPKAEIRETLRGVVTPVPRAMLRRHLATVDHLQAMIAEIDTEVAALLDPSRRQVERLDTIPGVDIATAEVIVAEVGVDMSRFPTAAHLVSWAGLAPRSDERAGKRRNTRIGKGGQWLKATLVQAAWAATRKRGSHLQGLYMRLTGKRGPTKAIIAVAAETIRSAWFMLTRNEAYREPHPTTEDPARKEREARRLVGILTRLGYEVEMPIAAK